MPCGCKPSNPSGFKYKGFVRKTFPKNPEDPVVMPAVARLTLYIGLNPDRLPTSSRYLEKLIRKELYKRRYNQAINGAYTFNALIKNCHRDLKVFYQYLAGTMRAMFEAGLPNLSRVAVELFVTFSKNSDDTAPMQADLDEFVEYLVHMALYDSSDEAEKQNQRISGLRGLRAYFHLVDDSSKWVSDLSSNSLQAVLVNSRYQEKAVDVLPNLLRDADEDTHSWTVPHLAEECLRDVASRMTVANVKQLVHRALVHVEENNLWLERVKSDSELKDTLALSKRSSKRGKSTDVSHETAAVMKVASSFFVVHLHRIIGGQLKPQNLQAAIETLVARLESEGDTTLKKQIVLVILSVLRGSILSVHSLMRSLLGQLSQSFKRQRALVSAKRKKGDGRADERSDHDDLQRAIIACLGVVGAKVQVRQKTEALAQVSATFAADHSNYEKGAATAYRRLLMSSMFEVARGIDKVNRGRDNVFSDAFDCVISCADDEATDVRVLALRVANVLLRAQDSLTQVLTGGPASPRNASGGGRQLPGRKPSRSGIELDRATSSWRKAVSGTADEPVWLRRHDSISRMMYRSLLFSNNTVDVFSEVLQLFQTALEKFGNHELVQNLPLVFRLQDRAVRQQRRLDGEDESDSMTSIESVTKDTDFDPRRVHTLVAAYTWSLSRLYGVPELETYVTAILSQRREAREGSPDMDVALVDNDVVIVNRADSAEEAPKKKSKRSKKKAAAHPAQAAVVCDKPVSVLIERDHVVEILCKIEKLTQSVENAEEKLMRVFVLGVSTASVDSASVSPRGGGVLIHGIPVHDAASMTPDTVKRKVGGSSGKRSSSKRRKDRGSASTAATADANMSPKQRRSKLHMSAKHDDNDDDDDDEWNEEEHSNSSIASSFSASAAVSDPGAVLSQYPYNRKQTDKKLQTPLMSVSELRKAVSSASSNGRKKELMQSSLSDAGTSSSRRRGGGKKGKGRKRRSEHEEADVSGMIDLSDQENNSVEFDRKKRLSGSRESSLTSLLSMDSALLHTVSFEQLAKANDEFALRRHRAAQQFESHVNSSRVKALRNASSASSSSVASSSSSEEQEEANDGRTGNAVFVGGGDVPKNPIVAFKNVPCLGDVGFHFAEEAVWRSG